MGLNRSACMWAASGSCNRQRETDVIQIWTLWPCFSFFLFVFRLISSSVSSSTSIRTTHCTPLTHHHNWMTDGAMKIRNEWSTRIAMGGLETRHVSSLRYVFITIFYNILITIFLWVGYDIYSLRSWVAHSWQDWQTYPWSVCCWWSHRWCAWR